MHILGLPGDRGACAYYRVEKPLEALAEAGLAEVYVPPIKNGQRLVRAGDLTDEEKREIIDKKGPWEGDEEIRRFEALTNVFDYDLVVFQRQPDESTYKLIQRVQREGMKTVYDIDDDAFSIPPTNPNYMAWGRDGRKLAAIYQAWDEAGTLLPKWRGMTPQEAVKKAKGLRDGLFRNIREAALVTTTTPALVKAYERMRRGLIVLPNQMCEADWEGLKPISHPGEIWMGWAGGWTHYDDLKMLERIIPAILEKYPQVCFVIAGFPDAKRLFFEAYPDHRVITFPWSNLKAYRNYLASFDIVLAPSCRTKFNDGKSDIRVLEAGMVSRPVIGSPTTYGATIKESRGGFVAKKWIDWVKAIERLVEDSGLRKALGKTLSQYVRSKRTYQANAHLWQRTYSKLVEA